VPNSKDTNDWLSAGRGSHLQVMAATPATDEKFQAPGLPPHALTDGREPCVRLPDVHLVAPELHLALEGHLEDATGPPPVRHRHDDEEITPQLVDLTLERLVVEFRRQRVQVLLGPGRIVPVAHERGYRLERVRVLSCLLLPRPGLPQLLVPLLQGGPLGDDRLKGVLELGIEDSVLQLVRGLVLQDFTCPVDEGRRQPVIGVLGVRQPYRFPALVPHVEGHQIVFLPAGQRHEPERLAAQVDDRRVFRDVEVDADPPADSALVEELQLFHPPVDPILAVLICRLGHEPEQGQSLPRILVRRFSCHGVSEASRTWFEQAICPIGSCSSPLAGLVVERRLAGSQRQAGFQ